MRRLRNGGDTETDGRIEQKTLHARHAVLADVDRALEDFKAVLHPCQAQEQKAEREQEHAKAFSTLVAVEVKDHAKDDERHRVHADLGFQAEVTNNPRRQCSRQVHTEDHGHARGERNQAGRQERHGDDGNQTARLHQSRQREAENERFPVFVSDFVKENVQDTARKNLETFFEQDHGKKEQANAGANGENAGILHQQIQGAAGDPHRKEHTQIRLRSVLKCRHFRDLS